jgi:hypothetical protein
MGQFIREAVGVFKNSADLEAAITELEATAFPRQDITILGDSKDIESTYGSRTVHPDLVKDNPHAPRMAPLRTEEKAVGTGVIIGIPAYFCGCVAALVVNPAPGLVLLSAVTGGSLFGALIGGGLAWLAKNSMENRTKEQIRKGGLVLWVRTPSPNFEKEAQDIMHKHGADDVHIHTIM